MRICVFGAGAVGGHIAAKLSAAGNDVSIVTRGAHLAAIRARGIHLHTGERVVEAKVRASDNASDLGPQDIVLATLKASGLGALVDGVAPLLGKDTAVVFVQNGIPWWYAHGLSSSRPTPPDLSRLDPGGVLARVLLPDRVIGGVVYSSNEVVEPGVIHNGTPNRNILHVGETDDRPSARIDRLREILVASGMASPPTSDIRLNAWHKLMANLSGSVMCLLTGQAIPVLKEPAINVVCRCALAEGLATARAHGVNLDIDVEQMYGAGRVYQNHKPSILQDYELGRPMEIEAIVKAPHAFACAAGLDTPTLDVMVALAANLAAAKGLYSAA